VTFSGLFSREPAQRASSLYHLGMDVSFKAKQHEAQHGLTPDQNKVVSIFLHATKAEHDKAKQETWRA